MLETYTIAGFLVAEHLAEHPQNLERIVFARRGATLLQESAWYSYHVPA